MIVSTLSAEAIQSFQTLYEAEFGELLSEDEAQILAKQLLSLFLRY